MQTTVYNINEETGGFFNPTPKDLARKIEDVIEIIEKYNPRDYVKKITGKSISLQKLKGALKEACKIYGEEYSFDDVDWDGRNQSLIWGKRVFEVLDKYKI